jgi:CheY-like chemotaxis protein
VSVESPLAGAPKGDGGGRSHTVLVVDDNEVALRVCGRVLEMAGHKVLTASDGLLLDDAMPGMDSLWVMRQIKKQRPGTAIVIASVDPSTGNRGRFLSAGANDVLNKPFRLSDLAAVVATLAAKPAPPTSDPACGASAAGRRQGTSCSPAL